MKKILYIILGLIIVASALTVSAQVRTFTSLQLAPSPSNGNCLTTNGTDNAWGSCGSGSGAPFAWTVRSYGVSTSTTLGFLNGFLSTASSTVNSTLLVTGNLTNSTLSTGRIPYISTGGLFVTGSNLAFDDTLGKITTTEAQSTRSTSTSATSTNFHVSNNLNFGGVSRSTWAAFCTSITGGAGLCDGSDDGAGGSSFGEAWRLVSNGDFLAATSSPIKSVVVGATTTASLDKSALFQVNATGTTGNLIKASTTAGFTGNVFLAEDSAGADLLKVDSAGLLTNAGAIVVSTSDNGASGIIFGDITNNASLYRDGSNGSLTFGGENAATTFTITAGDATANAVVSILGLTSDRTITLPDLSGVPALGSYNTGFTSGHVPFGSSGLLATSSALIFDSSLSKLTVTNASTTNLSIVDLTSALLLTGSTGIVAEYAGSACGGSDQVTSISALGVVTCSAQGSGGGGGEDFSYSQALGYSITGSATSTPIRFTGSPYSIIASSTAIIDTLLVSTTTATSTSYNAWAFGNSITARDNLLNIDCDSRVWPASATVGGCVHINNGTVNTGPGLEVVSGVAASAAPLVQVNVTNSTFAHSGQTITYSGAGDGLTITGASTASNAGSFSNAGVDHTLNLSYTGSTANKGALNLSSTNAAGSAVQVVCVEDGLACIKATQTSTSNDPDSSVINATQGGTAGQNIFADSPAGHTGKILNLRSGGTEILTLRKQGLGLGTTTPYFQLQIASSTGSQIALSSANATSNRWK